ncbi:MAG: HAMP domain-containing sensor histidine kinase [Chloroflexota bacterium]
MDDLAQWIIEHGDALIQAASAELASDESLRATVEESIAAFYEALARTADIENMVPLHAILIDWVEARSAPTDEEPTGLLPVLATLKRVAWHQICQFATPAEAVDLLLASEEIFTDAATYLASLEVEALLNDMRRELAKAQTHVQRLDKNKSDFLAVAAHELKTPLTLIEGYTNMLRGDINEPEMPRAALMISGISGGTARLKEIIDDMIDVSLIDMRMLPLHFQPVWIHSVIQMVEFDLGEAMHQRNIELIIKYEALKDRLTYGDPERLHQVFQKVISNAVKYTPDGGSVTISARDLPGFTDVTISDTGIGIPLENLPRIFDKFSSMTNVARHSSGKIKYRGAGPGLGLAIAKGIIEAHGGSIWAESPGYDEKKLPGSIFHIMVPMRTSPPEDELASLYNLQPEIEAHDLT